MAGVPRKSHFWSFANELDPTDEGENPFEAFDYHPTAAPVVPTPALAPPLALLPATVERPPDTPQGNNTDTKSTENGTWVMPDVDGDSSEGETSSSSSSGNSGPMTSTPMVRPRNVTFAFTGRQGSAASMASMRTESQSSLKRGFSGSILRPVSVTREGASLSLSHQREGGTVTRLGAAFARAAGLSFLPPAITNRGNDEAVTPASDLSAEALETLAQQVLTPLTYSPTCFQLRNRKLGAQKVVTLIELLRQRGLLDQLTTMSLSSCWLGHSGLRMLVQDLLGQPNSIAKLDVSFNSIGIAGLMELAQSLKNNEALTELNIRGNCGQLTQDMQRHVHHHLNVRCTQNRITVLDLSRNDIRPSRLVQLADAFVNTRVLQELKLANNPLGDDGCRQLCLTFLQHSPHLTSLDLSATNISTEGIETLCFFLKRGKIFLEVLDLSDNPVGDPGFLSLTAAVEKNSTLRVLKLNNSRLTCEIGWSLLTLCLNHKSLQRLSFAGTDLALESCVSEVTLDDRPVLQFFETLRGEKGSSLAAVRRTIEACPALIDARLWGETPAGVAYSSGNTTVGKMLAERAKGGARDYFSLMVLTVGLVVLLVDVGSDIAVTIKYFMTGYTKAGIIAIVVLLASTYLVAGVLYYDAHFYSRKQIFKTMPDWRLKLIPILPVYEAYSISKGIRESYAVRSKQYKTDLEGLGQSLQMCESVFESAPFLVLQVYLFIQTFRAQDAVQKRTTGQTIYNHLIDISGMVMSLISIVKAIVMYISMRRRKRTTNWMGVRTLQKTDDMGRDNKQQMREESLSREAGLSEPLLSADSLEGSSFPTANHYYYEDQI